MVRPCGGDACSRHVALPDSPEAPRNARHVVAELVREFGWHGSDGADTAALLTSEVVTNAYRHAALEQAGHRVFWLVAAADTDGTLRVELRDPDQRRPVAGPGRTDATCGRGLALVARMAKDWGVRVIPAGKVVWFTLDLRTETGETVTDP